tara:strand:+ start:3756 stop:4496 length:741 start_codon:yes stop_codon:yes gene_type:complete
LSVQACANLVARADPERFAAAMMTRLPVRKVLFPVYAFAAEVSRAPWMTQEQTIAEIRLQWWRDALDGIRKGNVRRHEVLEPLAKVLTQQGNKALDVMVEARRWDIQRQGFEDPDSLLKHVEAIAFGPLSAALDSLGHLPDDDKKIRNLARQIGLARFLCGIRELIDLNVPIWSCPQKDNIYSNICEETLSISGPTLSSPALIETANFKRILRFVTRNPRSVESGTIPGFPLRATGSRILFALKNN